MNKNLLKILVCIILAFALGILTTLIGLHHIAPRWVVYLASAITGCVIGSLLHDVLHTGDEK
jgi:uncharacterized membrane protein AbrB (regulator of aidB expression)